MFDGCLEDDEDDGCLDEEDVCFDEDEEGLGALGLRKLVIFNCVVGVGVLGEMFSLLEDEDGDCLLGMWMVML